MNLALQTNPSLLNDLQEQLNALWEDQNNLHDDSWRINGEPLFIGEFCKLLSDDAPTFSQYGISAELAIKLILINSIDKGLSPSMMKIKLDFCLLMFFYMQSHQIAMIDRDDVTEIFAYFLMHSITYESRSTTSEKPRITKRLSPRCGNVTFITFFIKNVLKTLRLNGFDVATSAVRDLSENKTKGMLKDAIDQISLGELTYQDWLKGESFNNLTLDHGRHYIEYLQGFYEDNYAIAQAFEEMYRKGPEIAAKFGRKPGNESQSLITAILLHNDGNKRLKELSKKKFPKFKAMVEQEYQRSIQPILIKQFILGEQTVARIGEMIGVVFDDDRSSHIAELERLRNLLFFILDDSKSPDLKRIIQNSNFKTNASELRKIIKTISKEVPQASLPPKGYIEQFTNDYYGKGGAAEIPIFIRKVRQAGMCCVAAYTGWRKSEFGFPLSAISSILNHDTIDQYALPYRHKIKWHVFKTQKGALSEREITQKTFELILSLSDFHRPNRGEPAIYAKIFNTMKNDPSSKDVSGNKFGRAATANWYNFVTYHKPFIALREIEEYKSLNQLKSLSHAQSSRLAELTDKQDSPAWQYARNNVQLNETLDVVQKELAAVCYKNLDSDSPIYKNSISQYRQHLMGEKTSLRPTLLTMFEERLPKEVKQRLIDTPDDLKALRKEIVSFLYADLTYPTPHAFRHMWAEAVFRRFDGDAGWMIRSNFKHISESMWLAYIADKSTMRGLEQLKVNVASKVMKNWLRNKGSKTAGKYHKFLRRLFRNTTVATYQDAEALIDKIASEDVTSIKANPWGFCINRLSTSALAKCASDGEAKPQNATPQLCMGCINFITCDANVDYIIEHSLQHVYLLNSEHVTTMPKALIAPSVNYVALARKRIAEIEPRHKILEQFDLALENVA